MKPSKLIRLIMKSLAIVLLIAVMTRGILVLVTRDPQGALDSICVIVALIMFAIKALVLVMLFCEWLERIVKRADQEWEEANNHKFK